MKPNIAGVTVRTGTQQIHVCKSINSQFVFDIVRRIDRLLPFLLPCLLLSPFVFCYCGIDWMCFCFIGCACVHACTHLAHKQWAIILEIPMLCNSSPLAVTCASCNKSHVNIKKCNSLMSISLELSLSLTWLNHITKNNTYEMGQRYKNEESNSYSHQKKWWTENNMSLIAWIVGNACCHRAWALRNQRYLINKNAHIERHINDRLYVNEFYP